VKAQLLYTDDAIAIKIGCCAAALTIGHGRWGDRRSRHYQKKIQEKKAFHEFDPYFIE